MSKKGLTDRDTANYAIKATYKVVEHSSDDVKNSGKGILTLVFRDGEYVIESESIEDVKNRITKQNIMTNTKDIDLRRIKAIVNTFHKLRGEEAVKLNSELDIGSYYQEEPWTRTSK